MSHHRISRRPRLARLARLAGVVAVALAGAPVAHAVDVDDGADQAGTPTPWLADYEGDTIDLRNGWDGARACYSDGVVSTCFDDEAAMLAATGDGTTTSGWRRAACSSSVRLYSGTSYSGSVLWLSTQFSFLNLSNYGFNNITSSYRIGACGSTFYDLNNGGAPQYGGATWAGASSASMLAGWDNRVSSVFIGS